MTIKNNYAMRNTFSMLFFIRKARLNKQGEAPILVRITVNGISQEAVIGRSIAPEQWNQQAERATGKDRLSFEVNAYIDTVSQLKTIVELLEND